MCYWESILLTVGPQKDWFKYPCDGPVHLLPEIDGVRIIGHNTNEFLQRLPGGSMKCVQHVSVFYVFRN